MEKTKAIGIVLFFLSVAIFLISLSIGRYPLPLGMVFKIPASKFFSIQHTWSENMEIVLLNIRLPRAIVAMLVGAGLSISGASFQGIFKNPLVSPYILGVSAGAGFGAALAILLSGSMIVIQLSAFVFGAMAVALTYVISRIYKTTPILVLVLAGIVVGAFFSALISLVKYVADPTDKLPAIVFWLMGSLASVTTKDAILVTPPIVAGLFVLLLLSWRINILSMGDEDAQTLGINTEKLKLIIIISVTVITASAVCVSGIIGWVGLIIPHVARMIVGPDHKVLLPVSAAIGASYLLLVDSLARTMTTAEIPLGIITAIVGAPFFAYLLRKSKGGWA
ncbi:MAG: iron ABC transporter permease [Caldisericia bacterium]|nr:iron ABC transporter permease [Caldisericia bacterium]